MLASLRSKCIDIARIFLIMDPFSLIDLFRLSQSRQIYLPAHIRNMRPEITPVMIKSPAKLLKLRLDECGLEFWLAHKLRSPNHFFSIRIISSPSVTFKIALEMSATKGEPLGKA